METQDRYISAVEPPPDIRDDWNGSLVSDFLEAFGSEGINEKKRKAVKYHR